MSVYFLLKTLHIISSTLLFGCGLGIAFFMWRADRSENIQVIAHTARQVVVADACFTLPAVLLQLASGFGMAAILGFGLQNPWLKWSMSLFILVGLCWLPVLWIQYRVATMAGECLRQDRALPREYKTLMTFWYCLGWPAFLSVLLIFYLMVAKP